jgi:hypothetical protein
VTPRRIALGAVLLSIVAALVGLLVGRSIESPADAALGAKAPPSGPITVPIERRVLSADLRIRGTLGATDSTEVTLAPSTIGSPDNVVVRAPAQGDTVNEGDVILVVGNRPVIALVGDLPMYRDLGPGDLGDDVRLIEEALGRLGYFTMTADDTYDADTAAAVEKLYQGRGFAPIGAPAEVTEEIGRLTGEADAAAKERDVAALRRAQASLKAARAKAGARLPANEVVLAPRLPARVAKAAVKRGSRIDGAVMTLGSEVAQIRSSVAEADRTLVKPKQIAQVELTDTGDRFSATVVSVASEPGTNGAGPERYAVTLAPTDAPANSFGADVTITLRVRSTDGKVLVVPAAALSLGGDGATRVEVVKPVDGQAGNDPAEDSAVSAQEAATVKVKPGLTAGGLVEVTPAEKDALKAGDEVVVGTADGTPTSTPVGGATGSSPDDGADANRG